MNIIEQNCKVLLQQHEGNRQFASALADGAYVLLRRLTTLLANALRRVPGAYPS